MTLEEALVQAIGPLVGERVYPDVTPAGVQFPCVTYQQVGGDSKWYADQKVADKQPARIQINVHSQRRLEANQLARQIERSIATSFSESQSYGGFIALYDDGPKLYGTRQDFGIQFAVSL